MNDGFYWFSSVSQRKLRDTLLTLDYYPRYVCTPQNIPMLRYGSRCHSCHMVSYLYLTLRCWYLRSAHFFVFEWYAIFWGTLAPNGSKMSGGKIYVTRTLHEEFVNQWIECTFLFLPWLNSMYMMASKNNEKVQLRIRLRWNLQMKCLVNSVKL